MGVFSFRLPGIELYRNRIAAYLFKLSVAAHVLFHGEIPRDSNNLSQQHCQTKVSLPWSSKDLDFEILDTPPKTNGWNHKNGPLEKEIPNLETILFRFHVSFRGCISSLGKSWGRLLFRHDVNFIWHFNWPWWKVPWQILGCDGGSHGSINAWISQ